MQEAKVIQFPKEKVKPNEYGYTIRLQYDPTFDHYLVSSSFPSGPNNMFIDGAVAKDRFEEYMKLFFHEVEDYKRKVRESKK